jgi:dTDP-4-dehydrorhamnose reductase
VKFLVIGASGQVGHHVSWLARQRGHQVMGTSFSRTRSGLVKLDVAHRADCESLAHIFKPDVVVLAGALTNVERCETEPALARAINVEGTRNVLEQFAPTRATIVYFSTEYVFDGVNGPYREDAPIHPISVYGRTKAEAETLVRDYPRGWLILRTTVVYGYEPSGRNFLMQTLNKLRASEPMRVPADQISSPTFNFNLAQATVELIERGHTGTFHVAGNEIMSRDEFARVICRVFGLDSELIQPVATAELGQKAARPLKAGLVIDKAQSVLRGVRLRGPHEALEDLKKNWNTYAASWEQV